MRFSFPTVRKRTALTTALAVCIATIAIQRAAGGGGPPAGPRWWKGNLHAHSNWVDGDDFPEMVADNYKRRGYHFLVLSSHNGEMIAGPRWRDLGGQGARGITRTALDRVRRRFGKDWVQTRALPDGRKQVRLRRLEEIRPYLEKPDRFLLIQGEEITDNAWRGPVHLNVMNIRDVILPQGGGKDRRRLVRDVLANNLAAVEKQRKRTGQPMLVQINHPNYHWAVTAEHIAGARGARFFEVYNGHPGVHNYGDPTGKRPGTERMWDIALTLRLSGQAATTEPLYGVAVDDAHHYHGGTAGASPGRGWIMVRAPILRTPDLVAAMEKGDFYASTGVTLSDVRFSGRALSLKIAAQRGVTYTTRFIGTRRGFDRRSTEVVFGGGRRRRFATRRYSKDVGAVLAEVKGASPRYTLRGDELYVRATVLSSKPHPNPYRPGDKQVAWTQPVFPARPK